MNMWAVLFLFSSVVAFGVDAGGLQPPTYQPPPTPIYQAPPPPATSYGHGLPAPYGSPYGRPAAPNPQMMQYLQYLMLEQMMKKNKGDDDDEDSSFPFGGLMGLGGMGLGGMGLGGMGLGGMGLGFGG